MRDRALGATVRIYFTTHTFSTGVVVAPSSAFAASDFKIYKNGSSTEKTTTNGITVTSPFDSQTGAHLIEIDTSNSTGDSGFWASGSAYRVILSTAKTVDSKDPSGVCVGEFSIELQTATLANTAHGGTSSTLTLERIIAASTTTNEPAFKLTGNGSAPGIKSIGGATGYGVWFQGGATSGHGIYSESQGGNSASVHFVGIGGGAGFRITGGTTGNGVTIVAGATSGAGISVDSTSNTNTIILNGGTGEVNGHWPNIEDLITALATAVDQQGVSSFDTTTVWNIRRNDSYDGTANDAKTYTVTKNFSGWTGTFTIRHRTTGTSLCTTSVTVTNATTLTVSLTATNTAFATLVDDDEFGPHPFDIQMASGSSRQTLAGIAVIIKDVTTS